MPKIHPVTADAISPEAPPRALLNAESMRQPTPLRILIAEDDALIGMLLGDMLEAMGHDVCAIETTEAEAVKAAAQFAPDVMIIDAHLREGSGMAAVDQIIANGFVPHVFVTGDQRSVSKLRPGAVVIAKPFTEAMLVDAIVLARKSAR